MPDVASVLAHAFGITASKLNDGLRDLVQRGIDNFQPADLMRVAPFEYMKEMEVMAEVRAYFDVSYKVSRLLAHYSKDKYLTTCLIKYHT